MRFATPLAVAAVAAVTLTGCVSTTAGHSISTPRSTRAASPTLEANPVDPYSSNGQWLVPDEIRPGNYRVALQPGKSHGYGAVCGDYECDPFGGMLSNDNYDGPGLMVVPQNAVMVEIRNIALTPLPTRP